jgi:AraC-like DNA-binding protein
MLERIVFLLTAILGFTTVLLIGFRFKTNRHTNFYLIVFFFLSSLRFLIHSISDSFHLIDYQKNIDFIFVISAWPLLYLYFSNLINNNTSLKSLDLIHYFAPLLFFFLFCIKKYVMDYAVLTCWKIGFIIEIFINIAYAIASYKLLKEKLWKRKSDILVINQQNNIIKRWTQLLFSIFTLMLTRFIIGLTLNDSFFWYINQNRFLWVGAVIWIALYIKILYSPEFLYGYDIFQSKIKELKKHAIIFDNIWITKTTIEITNIQDLVLKEKIASNIENYILDIEQLALNTNLFFDKNFKTKNLADKLAIPKSHVLFVFKYHAAISFADFRKIIRIQKTILLIEEGYLKTNTMESLSEITGFISYSNFFKSFKSITGVSPQVYIRD